ncbi:MAG: hypothetical protein OHK0022_34300 [Roseiflexaceae bacterium]
MDRLTLLQGWIPAIDLERLVRGWLAAVVGYLPTLLLILGIILVALFVGRRSHAVVMGVAERSKIPPDVSVLLARVVRVGVYILAAMLILDRLQFGTAVTSFVAGLGITSIVIGFALQDIVKQFAAGVLLTILRPFKVGDCIRVSGFEGRVQEIQMRATVLKTAEGDEVLIPNADVYNNALVNKSRHSLRHRTLSLRAPRGVELEPLRADLLKAIGAVPGLASNPALELVATGLDDTAVLLELRFAVDSRNAAPDAVVTQVLSVAGRALDRHKPG